MCASQTAINQKEYLKKYLCGRDSGAKKKKKKKQATNVKIIDDDELNCAAVNLLEEDPFDTNEDAPQIAGIVDERPPSMRIDEQTKDNLWKPLGAVGEQLTLERPTMNKFKIIKSQTVNLLDSQTHKDSGKKMKAQGHLSTATIITGKHSFNKEQRGVDVDLLKCDSPVVSRRRHHVDSGCSSDNSPPRRPVSQEYSKDAGVSSVNVEVESQVLVTSPSRSRRDPSPDMSPPRPRKIPTEKGRSVNRGPVKDDDCSPPRRRTKSSADSSSPSQPHKRNLSSDQSPPRKRATSKRDQSPSPFHKHRSSSSADRSPLRRNRKRDSDTTADRSQKCRTGSSDGDRDMPEQRGKLKETLDGKRAGLQNARELVREMKEFKKREEQRFQMLSRDESGVNADVIFRDKKTGKVRDLAREAVEQQQKQEEENRRKEKYDRWGRGVKQSQDSEKRAEEMLHEMNKPLARYADDEDLEKHLKEQEREGDPMLAYIRQKKRKLAKHQPNYSEKPEYKGEFLPNRYGIRPGHRWDGVDRSNGFEKKYFEMKNQKKATLDEMHAWNTEDM